MEDFETKYYIFLLFEGPVFSFGETMPVIKRKVSYIPFPFDSEQDAINHTEGLSSSFFIQKCYIKKEERIS